MVNNYWTDFQEAWWTDVDSLDFGEIRIKEQIQEYFIIS